MVEIRRVRTKKDRKNFIKFENKLYNECEYFIPTIYKEEIKLFSAKKNPNLMSNETTAYLAYQNGKIVGRVLCAFNRIEKDKKNIIRFSHLDFVNDSEVSFALLEMVEDWARFLKTDRIIGDISFNDLENIGILNSGFDKFATYQHRYNYPYYSQHLKNYGYNACKKMYEYQLKLKENVSTNIDNALLEESKYKIVVGDKQFKIKNYGRKIFDLVYNQSVSSFPIVIEERVYENFFKSLNKLFNDDDLFIIINESDDVVGAMLLTQNTSLALQTTEGKEFASKNNYNVDINNHKYIDLSFYVVDKNINDDIEKYIIQYLIDSMISKGNIYLNTNLWIQDIKESIINTYFETEWKRERVIFAKSLKLPNIKRNKDELINRPMIVDKSSIV